MSTRRFLFLISLLAAISTAAWAGVIKDPAMGVDVDSNSDPVSGGINFTPQDGGGVFSYFNDTGYLITELIFSTFADAGLPQQDVIDAFVCNASENQNPFFLDCSVDYQPSDGKLTIAFFGINPPDDDGILGEAGDQEGIGPVRLCVGCGDLGHFVITLNDNFATVGEPRGGWGDATLFPDGPPTINGTAVLTPEPSTMVLIGAALIGLGVIRRRQRGHGESAFQDQ